MCRGRVALLVVYRTWEQQVNGSIPSLTNFFVRIDGSHCRPLFNPTKQQNFWQVISECINFADDKINVTENFKLVLRKVKKIVGKAENASYQHFLLFPQYFQKATFSASLKVEMMCESG